MRINTKRFGELEIDPKNVLTFPNGLLGFKDVRDYILIDPSENSPLKWLQSVDVPELAFVVTDPLLFKPDYEIRIYRTDLEDIEVTDPDHVIQLVIVTVPRDPSKMTANLKGPLLINTENNMGKQLVLDDSEYELKYQLLKNKDIAKAV